MLSKDQKSAHRNNRDHERGDRSELLLDGQQWQINGISKNAFCIMAMM